MKKSLMKAMRRQVTAVILALLLVGGVGVLAYTTYSYSFYLTGTNNVLYSSDEALEPDGNSVWIQQTGSAGSYLIGYSVYRVNTGSCLLSTVSLLSSDRSAYAFDYTNKQMAVSPNTAMLRGEYSGSTFGTVVGNWSPSYIK